VCADTIGVPLDCTAVDAYVTAEIGHFAAAGDLKNPWT